MRDPHLRQSGSRFRDNTDIRVRQAGAVGFYGRSAGTDRRSGPGSSTASSTASGQADCIGESVSGVPPAPFCRCAIPDRERERASAPHMSTKAGTIGPVDDPGSRARPSSVDAAILREAGMRGMKSIEEFFICLKRQCSFRMEPENHPRRQLPPVVSVGGLSRWFLARAQPL